MTVEIGTAGIRIHAVVPGMIWTPFTVFMLDASEMGQRTRKRDISGQIGAAQEGTAATAFLASEDASFVAGAMLTMDGGSSAGRW